METGFRVGADGQLLPRDIVRRFSCRYNGELVFAPSCSRRSPPTPTWRSARVAPDSGTLDFVWEGDNGFQHREQRTISVA